MWWQNSALKILASEAKHRTHRKEMCCSIIHLYFCVWIFSLSLCCCFFSSCVCVCMYVYMCVCVCVFAISHFLRWLYVTRGRTEIGCWKTTMHFYFFLFFFIPLWSFSPSFASLCTCFYHFHFLLPFYVTLGRTESRVRHWKSSLFIVFCSFSVDFYLSRQFILLSFSFTSLWVKMVIFLFTWSSLCVLHIPIPLDIYYALSNYWTKALSKNGTQKIEGSDCRMKGWTLMV